LIERQLRLTGISTGSVFAAGGLLTFILGLLAGRTIITSFVSLSVIGCLLIAILFFVSARWPRLFWLQPVIFLAITPIPLLQNPQAFYGLGFFVCGAALCYRLGFFEKHRILRLSYFLVYLLAIDIVSFIIEEKSLADICSAIFFILAFLMFFYLMFQDKLMVFLSEPKEKLSLGAKDLSDTEIDYIMAVISGKSVKETAFDSGVSESTVRNMLARGYTKLGVSNRAELFTLAEKYDIVK
jgi:DNA-binding CsgD family transcriptional regulator